MAIPKHLNQALRATPCLATAGLVIMVFVMLVAMDAFAELLTHNGLSRLWAIAIAVAFGYLMVVAYQLIRTHKKKHEHKKWVADLNRGFALNLEAARQVGFVPDNGLPFELNCADLHKHSMTFGQVGWRPFSGGAWESANGSTRDEIQARWDQRKLERGTAEAKAGSRKTWRL